MVSIEYWCTRCSACNGTLCSYGKNAVRALNKRRAALRSSVRRGALESGHRDATPELRDLGKLRILSLPQFFHLQNGE